jgi:hypothetical protein
MRMQRRWPVLFLRSPCAVVRRSRTMERVWRARKRPVPPRPAVSQATPVVAGSEAIQPLHSINTNATTLSTSQQDLSTCANSASLRRGEARRKNAQMRARSLSISGDPDKKSPEAQALQALVTPKRLWCSGRPPYICFEYTDVAAGGVKARRDACSRTLV